MRRHARLLLGVCLALAACGGAETAPVAPVATWRADCVAPSRPAPLSIEAARLAHKEAARRHALQLREAAEPGSFLRDLHAALGAADVAAGRVCPDDLADLGQLLFEHEYGFADGLGGVARDAPTGPFRRIHAGAFGGPETVSCPSCHWVGGPNGAGAETDNAFIVGDGVTPSRADERNPPSLVGVGVVQALAAEMTRDLHRQRDALVREASAAGAAREQRLSTKGIDFGVLRAGDDGVLDFSGVDGVDSDLVVKPFGWKGNRAGFAEFAAEALQIHIGIQSDALLAAGVPDVVGQGRDAADPDEDGMRDELGAGPFAAMTAHLALLEMPIVEPLIQDRQMPAAAAELPAPTTTSFAEDFRRGRAQFHALGCAGCHQPMLLLESPMLTVEGMPPIDLSTHMRAPALRYDASLGGYPVWLFSDLKRHDMGPATAARRIERGVATTEYVTTRLWGLADSAPYLHDGRAPSFDYAIAAHDGEGAAARAAFEAVPPAERGPLRVYLMSLRRAPAVVVP